MKNKAIWKIIICFLLMLSISTNILPDNVAAKSSTYTADDLEKVIDGILSYKQSEAKASSVQEFIDTGLAAKAGTSPSEWYVIALSRYKEKYDYSKYLSSLDAYVKDMKTAKATDLQRIALAYSFTGTNDKFIKKTIKDSIGQLGIMSYIYGLILMDSRAYPSGKISREDIIDKLLSLRLKDGGWALTGKVSDVDVTAMTLQALAPHYEDSEVKAAVDGALALLSKLQLKSGDFKSWGVRSCESVAQVIMALSALDIDPQTDKRFIKNNKTLIDGLMLYSLSDGSFCHTVGGLSNDTASVQAMYSLIAAWRQSKELDAFYTITASEKAANVPEPAPHTEGAGNSNKPKENTNRVDTRLIVSVLLFGLMLIGLLILSLRRKLNRKNILFLAALTGIAVIGIWCVRIQSVTDYYKVNSEAIAQDSETVFISIRCDTVAGRESSAGIPADGVVLDLTEYGTEEGDSVFDVLVRAAKQNKIQLDYQGSDNNSLGTVYVKGINNLYEYDFGELSGWMYRVNGKFPGEGCDNYFVSDKDVIEWVYTCDLGKDVGGE